MKAPLTAGRYRRRRYDVEALHCNFEFDGSPETARTVQQFARCCVQWHLNLLGEHTLYLSLLGRSLNAGEWLVRYVNGNLDIVSDEGFRALFEDVPALLAPIVCRHCTGELYPDPIIPNAWFHGNYEQRCPDGSGNVGQPERRMRVSHEIDALLQLTAQMQGETR